MMASLSWEIIFLQTYDTAGKEQTLHYSPGEVDFWIFYGFLDIWGEQKCNCSAIQYCLTSFKKL